MPTKNVEIKRINISKFKYYTTYMWIHSESYNIFERLFIRSTLKKNSPRGQFAIDIGCGFGLVLKEMYPIYSYCIGIDISSETLQRAKIGLTPIMKKRIDLVCADIENMPFKDAVFDVACMYSVLHHLPNINASLEEVNRIIKAKSPLILFHEPNEKNVRIVLEKTLLRILWKIKIIFYKSIYKKKWLQVKHEARLRFRILGSLEKLADIHAEKGFDKDLLVYLLSKTGYEVIKICPRIQSFMEVFSRLNWPYKALAAIDFVVSKIPVLRDHLPLLLCIAEKKVDDESY